MIFKEHTLMDARVNLFTASEAAALADVPVKVVYKAVAERLPKASLVRRAGQLYLTQSAVICVRLDYELPKDVPVKVRRFVYSKVRNASSGRVEYGTKLFSYVIDPRPTASLIKGRMRRYSKAIKLIVEDPEIQGGAATFKGTRLLVHHIAALLHQGVPEEELIEDYPNLTAGMIAAARIFVQTHPRRGRPRKPSWRNSRPVSTELLSRRRV
jgi:uncharacterized protein (DUF433 family)